MILLLLDLPLSPSVYCSSNIRMLEANFGFGVAASALSNDRSRIDFGNPFKAARFEASLALLSSPISSVEVDSPPSLHVGGSPMRLSAGLRCYHSKSPDERARVRGEVHLVKMLHVPCPSPDQKLNLRRSA